MWSGSVSEQQRTSVSSTSTIALALLVSQLSLWKSNFSSRPVTHLTWGTEHTRHQVSPLPHCLRKIGCLRKIFPEVPITYDHQHLIPSTGKPALASNWSKCPEQSDIGMFPEGGDSPFQQGLGGEAGCPRSSWRLRVSVYRNGNQANM